MIVGRQIAARENVRLVYFFSVAEVVHRAADIDPGWYIVQPTDMYGPYDTEYAARNVMLCFVPDTHFRRVH